MSDKEYVDRLIKLIDQSKDDAALDHNRRLASKELPKIKDATERKRLEGKIKATGGSFN